MITRRVPYVTHGEQDFLHRVINCSVNSYGHKSLVEMYDSDDDTYDVDPDMYSDYECNQFYYALPDAEQWSCCHNDDHNLWLMDSGATSHSSPLHSDFFTYQLFNKAIPVGTAGKEVIYFLGMGNILLNLSFLGKKRKTLLRNVFHCPKGSK